MPIYPVILLFLNQQLSNILFNIMNKKTSKKNILLSASILYLLLVTSQEYCLAQESIIDEVINSKRSFVTIQALRHSVETPQNSGQYKLGSGVIISADGIVATNLHTIIDCNLIKVKLHNDEIHFSQVLMTLPSFDIALMKIKAAKPFVPIEFSDSNSVQLGQDIINVSSSELWQQTITGGIITGIGVSKQLDGQDIKGVEMIEINLNLDKGDSGGPLLNRSGELIGLITAKDVTQRRKSYAIPSNKILQLYEHYSRSK